MDTINEHKFDRWLTEDRVISLAVANEAGIELVSNSFGEEIKIPVRDTEGKHLFSKYRRSPWRDTGTKYRYDAGAHSNIFGLDSLKGVPAGETVIVCEGELDSLAMRTLGYHAISGTGGAGTFSDEWCDYLSQYDLVILYDADKAGIEGALRVAAKVTCRIAWIPVQFGKDCTDVILSEGIAELREAIKNASDYHVPLRNTEPASRIGHYKKCLDQFYREKLATLIDPMATPFHRDIAISYLQNEMKHAQVELERTTVVRKEIDGSAVEKAKMHPISALVKVNRAGFANCVYHDERSASMRVYRDNHAYSYCCSKRSDAIDIYQAIHENTPFKEAVKSLCL